MPARRNHRPRAPKAQPEGPLGTIIAHHGVAVKVALDTPRPEHPVEVVKVRPRSGHVVGDRVVVHGERLTRLPRDRALVRKHPGGGDHTLAAHLDVVAVVVASHPEQKPGLVDRAIVSARSSGIDVVVVVNKIEIDGALAFADAMDETYAASLPVLRASAHTEDGLDSLAELFRERGRGAFIGASGVGKSSLLNAMLPGTNLIVGEVSAATGKGRHTTVVATLHPLPTGGELVDTPGLRDFGLVHVAPGELATYFPGFEPLLETPCRFRDCRHEREPGCAILAARDAGILPAERLKTYHALLHELELAEEQAKLGRGR